MQLLCYHMKYPLQYLYIIISAVLDAKNVFSLLKFDEYKSSYDATEVTISDLKKNKNVKSFTHARNKYEAYDYLYNESMKTAVFLRCATELPANEFDWAKRHTKVSFARCAILYFLNNPKFQDYDLVAPIGNYNHECCIFFKNQNGCLKAIYYNPNYSTALDGVQSSNISKAIFKSFGRSIKSIEAYHSESGNTEEMCSGFTWGEIYNHVINLSAFKNNKIALENYNHLTTLKAYKGYNTKNRLNRMKHYERWKRFDEMLFDIDTSDTVDLATELSLTLSDYYIHKKN